MLRFTQHDKRCHSERQQGIHSWMLRFAQHDKRCHSERQRGIHSRMLRFTQHDKGENVIPNASEESSMDASLHLRSVQHDRFELPSLKSHKKIRRALQHCPSVSLPFYTLFSDGVLSESALLDKQHFLGCHKIPTAQPIQIHPARHPRHIHLIPITPRTQLPIHHRHHPLT